MSTHHPHHLADFATRPSPTPADVPALFHASEETRIRFALQTIHQIEAEQPAHNLVQRGVLMWVIRLLSIRLVNLRTLDPASIHPNGDDPT